MSENDLASDAAAIDMTERGMSTEQDPPSLPGVLPTGLSDGGADELLAGLPCAVWLADRHGRITYENDRCRALTGSAAPSGAWPDRLHPEDRETVVEALRDAARGARPVELTCRLQAEGDGYRPITFRAAPHVSRHGESPGLIGTIIEPSPPALPDGQPALTCGSFDPLTGLPGRDPLRRELAHAIDRARHDRRLTFALLLIDLDRFSVVNDSLGPGVGDLMIEATAHRLQDVLGERAFLARPGGDEFAVLLHRCRGLDEATDVAHQIISLLSTPLVVAGQTLVCTASVGVVWGNLGYDRPEHVLRDADIAMYRAKAEHRATAVVFDPAMHVAAVQRLELECDLRNALQQNQFTLAYQPIVRLSDGAVSGFEALLRWHHPTHGPISPDRYIPLAEETGLILPIGDWVLEQAARQLNAWRQSRPEYEHLTVNVNVSRRQLVKPGAAERFQQIVRDQGVEPDRVKLEITESAIMDDRDRLLPLLRALRDAGFRLAMDDFGTGHSSLSCLHRFPIDVLKIDRSFVRNLDERIEFAAVIQAIVTLAHTLRVEVVAEGIETEGQLTQLQALDCDCAQGYYFARAMAVDQAETYLLERHDVRRIA